MMINDIRIFGFDPTQNTHKSCHIFSLQIIVLKDLILSCDVDFYPRKIKNAILKQKKLFEKKKNK